LIVKAPPLEMYKIKRLLDQAIDKADADSNAVMKYHTIPLKNVTASEMAGVVNDLYRQMTDQNPTRGLGAALGTNRNVDASGQPRGVKLTVSWQDSTNTLLVNCGDQLYQEIKLLVNELDGAAASATATVKVFPIKGM